MNKRVLLLLLFILFSSISTGPIFAQSDSLRVLPGFGDPGSTGNSVAIDLKNSGDVGKMQFTLNRERQEAERKRIEAQGIADFQKVVSTGISQAETALRVFVEKDRLSGACSSL